MSGSSDPTQQHGSFQQATYSALKKDLDDTIKKIANYESRRNLPTDTLQRDERIQQYSREIIGTYNNFVVYLGIFYSTLALASQFKVNERVENFKV